MNLKEMLLTVYVFLENVATLFTIQWIVYHEACHVFAAKWIGAKVTKITWVKFATKDDLAHGRVNIDMDDEKATTSDRFVLAFAPQIIGAFIISLSFIISVLLNIGPMPHGDLPWLFQISWLVVPGCLPSPSDCKIFIRAFKRRKVVI